MKKLILKTIKVLLFLILVFIVIFIALIFYQSTTSDMDYREISLNNNMVKSKFNQTKFIFIFDEENKTVVDSYNLVHKIHIGLENENKIDINMINNQRLIQIKNGAILKTDNDSVDVEKEFTKLKGYMGIWDKEHTKFYVDKNGEFDAIEYRNKEF